MAPVCGETPHPYRKPARLPSPQRPALPNRQPADATCGSAVVPRVHRPPPSQDRSRLHRPCWGGPMPPKGHGVPAFWPRAVAGCRRCASPSPLPPKPFWTGRSMTAGLPSIFMPPPGEVPEGPAQRCTSRARPRSLQAVPLPGPPIRLFRRTGSEQALPQPPERSGPWRPPPCQAALPGPYVTDLFLLCKD